jgi:hypothetical protein
MVGKGPEFYCKDGESGEMAEHFDVNGRECVKKGLQHFSASACIGIPHHPSQTTT